MARRKPKGWKQITATTIDDPREDREVLKAKGIQPRRVLVSLMIDTDDQRWIDYHDGDGPQPLGGVPEVTRKT